MFFWFCLEIPTIAEGLGICNNHGTYSSASTASQRFSTSLWCPAARPLHRLAVLPGCGRWVVDSWHPPTLPPALSSIAPWQPRCKVLQASGWFLSPSLHREGWGGSLTCGGSSPLYLSDSLYAAPQRRHTLFGGGCQNSSDLLDAAFQADGLLSLWLRHHLNS